MEEDRPVGLDRLGSLRNTRKESNKGDRTRNKNHAWVLTDLSSVSETALYHAQLGNSRRHVLKGDV